MPMPFPHAPVPATWNRLPPAAPPSWWYARRPERQPGMTRAGPLALPASSSSSGTRLSALAREVMLGAVLGILGGWLFGWVASWALL